MDEPKDTAQPLGHKGPTISISSCSDPESPSSPSPSQPPAPEDQPAEMAPGGKPRPNTPKREADLSAILTTNEKSELTLLVNKATDAMQKHIIQVFDSTDAAEPSRPPRISFWSRLPAHLKDLSISRPQTTNQKRGANQKENSKPSNTATRNADKSASDDSITVEHEEDTGLGPRLQELKKEALLHFKKWQTAVHKRVGDISIRRTTETHSVFGPNGTRKGPSNNNRSRVNGPKTTFLEADPGLMKLYPPIPTNLCTLPPEKRCLLLHSLLLLFLSLEHYSAYTRVLMLHLASSLHIPLRILAEDEVRVAKGLSQVAKDISPDELIQKKSEETTRSSRRWKAGMASAAGALIVGIAGGLAAPLLAAGIGSVLGGFGISSIAAAGLLGTIAESGFIVGCLFGMYGARTSGKMMDQYSKEIQDFAFIPLRGSVGEDSEMGKVSPDSRRIRVVLGVGGWLSKESDITKPWQVLGQQNEVYAVKWEPEQLVKLGTSLETVVRSAAWSMAKKEIVARTSEPSSHSPKQDVLKPADAHGPVFSSLLGSLWPVGLLKISKVIDNPWSVGMVRADKLGTILADIIMNKGQGERGVSLIGFSLGARAIYVCLMVLAERRAFGLVENVVMMGTPGPSEARVWCTMKSVVTGRLVNVYSENDYILGFLYRMSSLQYGVAGLQRIEGIDGVENVDVSAKVSGHLRYQYLIGSILKHIGWEDIDNEEVVKHEVALAQLEERNREREKKRDAIERGIDVNKPDQGLKENKDQGIIHTRKRKNKRK